MSEWSIVTYLVTSRQMPLIASPLSPRRSSRTLLFGNWAQTMPKADIEAFTGALVEILEWLHQHDIDVVLLEPPYNAALVSDEHYTALRAAIRNGARQNGVPVVLRFEALHYLSQQRSEATRSQFGLSELGYRCMAEHVAFTIDLSVLQPAPLEIGPAK